MKLFKTLAFLAILGLGSLQGANYIVDSTHSSVGFKVKHMMISNVKGSFGSFSGNFSIDEKTKIFSSLKGVVDVSTITTKEKKRDSHLKSADFFDVAKYPTMQLELLEHKVSKLRVKLTIKNVTKIVIMDVTEINGPLKDPWGYTRMAFELHGKINRKDFNINFNQLLETGGLLVGDSVKIDLVLEGTRQKDTK